MPPATSDARALRVLQIGLGTWGESWANVLRDADAAEPVGWVDTDPAALAQAPGGLPTFRALDAAVAGLPDARKPDAALVATGLAAHAPVARAALEAGLHVLVEKPFAASAGEARELVQLAEERSLILMVSQNYRFHAGPVAVRRLVGEGRIGALGQVRIDFRKRFPPTPEHRYHASRQPLLLDMFVHHADLLRFVLGREPTWVEGAAWNPPWSVFGDPASAVLTIGLGEDLVAHWRGSWESTATPTLWSGDWSIEGEAGAIDWASRGNRDDREPDWVELRQDAAVRRVPLAPVAPRDRHGSLQAFAAAVRTGEPPSSSGRDNLGTLRLCLAAIRAVQEGRRVALEEL